MVLSTPADEFFDYTYHFLPVSGSTYPEVVKKVEQMAVECALAYMRTSRLIAVGTAQVTIGRDSSLRWTGAVRIKIPVERY